MTSRMPTIQKCFEAYLRGSLPDDIDPIVEREQRHAFFCGFASCLQGMELLAVIFEEGEDEGKTSVDQLIAEFERFVQGSDSGESTVNH